MKVVASKGEEMRQSAWIRKEISFADVLKGKVATTYDPNNTVETLKERVYPLIDIPLFPWLARSLVVVVYDVMQLGNIDRDLEKLGLSRFKTSCMGGDSVLITFDTMEVLEVWESELKPYFKSIHRWSADFVPGNRCVWLKIRGVPLHVWSNSFFKWLLSPLGEFIRIHELSASFFGLEEAHVLITTKEMDLIGMKMDVSIAEFKYNIWIKEVQFPGKDEEMNSSGSSPGGDGGRLLSHDKKVGASGLAPVSSLRPEISAKNMMKLVAFEASEVAESSFRGGGATSPPPVRCPSYFSPEACGGHMSPLSPQACGVSPMLMDTTPNGEQLDQNPIHSVELIIEPLAPCEKELGECVLETQLVAGPDSADETAGEVLESNSFEEGAAVAAMSPINSATHVEKGPVSIGLETLIPGPFLAENFLVKDLVTPIPSISDPAQQNSTKRTSSRVRKLTTKAKELRIPRKTKVTVRSRTDHQIEDDIEDYDEGLDEGTRAIEILDIGRQLGLTWNGDEASVLNTIKQAAAGIRVRKPLL